MKSSIIALASMVAAANAHATVWSISVNGKDQGNGNVQGGYIDTPPNNSPVTDVTSAAMECNVANIKASKSVSANAGDEIAVSTLSNNSPWPNPWFPFMQNSMLTCSSFLGPMVAQRTHRR